VQALWYLKNTLNNTLVSVQENQNVMDP
jgi:hypothetical protein